MPKRWLIMSAAPRTQSGAVAGILNFTRGLGTALGFALTALVIGRFAGPHAQSHLITESEPSDVELTADVAERFRTTFTEQLAEVGFSQHYELTGEGIGLEELIDLFAEPRS